VIPTPGGSGFEESGEPGSGTGWLRVVGEGFTESIEWMQTFDQAIKYAEGEFAELPAGDKEIVIYEVGGGILTQVSVTIVEGVMLTGTLSADTMSWDISVTPS
jgi:hypothetical protein